LETLELRNVLSTIPVTTLTDVVNETDGVTSLREAVALANPAGGDIINFDPNVPNMNGGIINLTLGEIPFNKSLTIDASGLANGITINGNDPTPTQNNGDGIRIFNITLSPTVTLKNLTFTGGDAAGGGGAIAMGIGGTSPNGSLTLQDCTISGNASNLDGGGVYFNGKNLSVLSTTFHDNHANVYSSNGGGLNALLRDGDLTITGSTFTGNTAARGGGGAFVDVDITSTATISNSEFTGNDASLDGVAGSSGGGGGLMATVAGDTANGSNGGTLTITDSVISGNSAIYGGGLRVGESLYHATARNASFTMQRTRVADNEAVRRGGGLYVNIHAGMQVRMEESVITGNDAGLTLSDNDYPLPDSGGGIYAYLFANNNQPKLTIAGTEISENTAGRRGGGLVVCTKRESGTSSTAQLSVYNSTISGNVAGHTTEAMYGGTGGGAHLAIYAGEPEEALNAHFQNVTITQNIADQGGGIFSMRQADEQQRNNVWLTNSIASLNTTHAPSDNENNLYGSFNITLTKSNLIGTNPPNSIFTHTDDDPASFDGTNILDDDTPELDPLAWNGGPTRTHRLQDDSEAIDAGNNSLAVIPFGGGGFLTVDQRGAGFTRPYNSVVDIGAYEVGLAKVIDVRLDSTLWMDEDLVYSYAEIVPTGMQLSPIATQNVNTIQIVFSEEVQLDGSEFKLYGSSQGDDYATEHNTVVDVSSIDFEYLDGVATWTFDDGVLVHDKYRIELSAVVTNLAGDPLDGEWDNLTNGSIDVFTDDPTDRPLRSGTGVEGGAFTFWFALLPGDSSQDGVVDSDDTSDVADVNGDGLNDNTDVGLINNGGTDDYDVENENGLLNKSLPVRNNGGENTNRGDYEDDEIVDLADFQLWKMTYGSTVDLRADGNGDGTVNAADYNLYRNNSQDVSAWLTDPAAGSGAGAVIVEFGIAPQVVNVTVSGADVFDDPFSLDTVDGSGDQLRTVPVGGADTISITFSEDVNVSEGMLDLVGLRTGYRPIVVDFDYDIGSQTAVWRFYDFAVGDQYLISLSDAITDVEGDRLDGEWVNPASIFTTNTAVSEFPSGDGNGGGDFNFVITLLSGDFSLDNIVDELDEEILDNYFESYYGGFVYGDGNGDGVVNYGDVLEFYATVGSKSGRPAHDGRPRRRLGRG
jgi:hypothetical protein